MSSQSYFYSTRRFLILLIDTPFAGKRIHTLNIRSFYHINKYEHNHCQIFLSFQTCSKSFPSLYQHILSKFSMLICSLVSHIHYVDGFQFFPIHQISSILNCFVGMSSFFIDAQFNSFKYFNAQPNMLLDFNYLRNCFDQEELSFSWLIMNLFILVIQIRRIFKLLGQLPEILVNNVSNGSPCLLFLVQTFGPEIKICSHPLTRDYHIIPRL